MDDRWAISDLLARYCHTLDRGDVRAVAGLFAPDAVLWPLFSQDEAVRGRVEILEFYRQYWDGVAATTRFLQHHIQAPSIDMDPDVDRASSICYFTANLLLKGNDKYRLSQGRYDDVLTKREGGWLFAERRIVVHYSVSLGEARAGRRPDG